MLRQKRSCILILMLIVMIAAASWRGWLAHHQATLDRAWIAAVTEDNAATHRAPARGRGEQRDMTTNNREIEIGLAQNG